MHYSCGIWRSCHNIPTDHASWPPGQDDIPLAEWFVCLTCNTGVWGLKPAWALCALPNSTDKDFLLKYSYLTVNYNFKPILPFCLSQQPDCRSLGGAIAVGRSFPWGRVNSEPQTSSSPPAQLVAVLRPSWALTPNYKYGRTSDCDDVRMNPLLRWTKCRGQSITVQQSKVRTFEMFLVVRTYKYRCGCAIVQTQLSKDCFDKTQQDSRYGHIVRDSEDIIV